jgi:hypothetical protein
MPKPEPPRPGHRLSVTEINLATTERPPAPDRRPPPKELAAPRAPLPSIRDQTIAELAEQTRVAKAEADQAKAEADQAKAEADALRAAAAAAKQAAPVVDSLAPGAERKALLRLAYKLGTPLVLLMGAATAWLTAHTANVERKIDRVEQNRTLDKVVTDPLPEKVSTNERATVDCREWAAATDDYYRQVFGKAGISIPLQPNAKPVTPIEARAPRRRPNTIGTGIVLEILTPPPPLP